MALELQTIPKAASATVGRKLDFNLSLSRLLARRVSDRDRMLFTEQLGLLLETGASLFNALQTLEPQCANPAMADIIRSLMADIAEGKAFSQALAKHPAVFSSNYVNLVAASETGGFLHTVLQELKSMDEKRDELRQSLVSALSYPIFLALFSVAVIIFVLLVVFPKFGDLFAAIQDQLPPTTKALMSLSDLMRNYWTYLLVTVGGASAGLLHWTSTPAGKELIDRALLRLPGLSAVFSELYMIQTLRVMSLSLGNGVPMLDTLRACRDVVNNRLFRRFIDRVATQVEEGKGIAGGFEDAAFVPAVAKAMISTAEETGNLATVASRVADYYEQELEKRLKTLSKMAEPIMLLVMGTVVGVLVSSLILPIFKLSRAVG